MIDNLNNIRTLCIQLLIGLLLVASCVKFPKIPDPVDYEFTEYLYPFNEEVTDVNTVITIETKGGLNPNYISAEIPFLKYNKSWLFTLTQDDCKQSAYSWTWAAINGYPLSNQYFYNFKNLWAGDLPPDHFYLGKTLGSTDGAGNEVRFTYTTTLAPQEKWMDEKTVVHGSNIDRFKIKSGLVWDNVREILNYGNSIAFHDVVTDASNTDSIFVNLIKAQDIILDKLKGRGTKVLAEPNGNKKYIDAALMFPEIRVMTAQNGQVYEIFPYTQNDNLDRVLIKRVFYNNGYEYQMTNDVVDNLAKPVENRKAMNIGVHGIDNTWLSNLVWLNDEYGKDGDDSMWFTSLEEYFEYNHYRQNSVINLKVEATRIIISLNLPMGKFFYFPSITLNVRGLTMNDVASLNVDEQVQGLSYANYRNNQGETMLMINLDCRKYLVQHATHFVERYEKHRSEPFKKDALYFTGKLKDSQTKQALMQRLN